MYTIFKVIVLLTIGKKQTKKETKNRQTINCVSFMMKERINMVKKVEE